MRDERRTTDRVAIFLPVAHADAAARHTNGMIRKTLQKFVALSRLLKSAEGSGARRIAARD
jgi:hypothetical protein